MTIEHIPTNSLKEHPDNPRVIKTGKFKDLCESIRRNLDYFETRPILANKDLVIFAGHMRWRAAQEIGLETVPCVIMDISDERQRELMVRDNVSSGEWDIQKLSLFAEPLLMNAGFTQVQLHNSFHLFEGDEEDGFDTEEAHEAVQEPITKRGDVIMLGKHRLMCGDATSENDMNTLMEGKTAAMTFTDPPWNVAIGLDSNPRHRQREGLINDDMSQGGFDDFLNKTAKMISAHCRGDVYCVMGSEQWPTIHAAFTGIGMHWSATIIWVKDIFVLGRSKYHRRYEPIWYGWKEGSSFSSDRKQDDVWEIPRPKRSPEHPTMKPVALASRAILNSSQQGDIILDCFLGGGTTLIAAQESDRICYGMELDPKYCDVIRLRWQRYQESQDNFAA